MNYDKGTEAILSKGETPLLQDRILAGLDNHISSHQKINAVLEAKVRQLFGSFPVGDEMAVKEGPINCFADAATHKFNQLTGLQNYTHELLNHLNKL